MGKRGKQRRRQQRKKVWEPDLDNPVCPTCAGNDALDEPDETGITHCTRCNINFWIEESEETVGDEDDGEFTQCGACHGKGCHICLPSNAKPELVVSYAPVLGKMVEL